MKSFGQTIKLGRFKQFLEAAQAADRMGICPAYLSRIENDAVQTNLQLIKSALRCGFITYEESQDFAQQLFERKAKSNDKKNHTS